MNCIIVLGMHRSGTSCLTGILQKSGVELGEVYTENPFNKKGNRENPDVMVLNDALLQENSCAWDRPGDVTVWTEEQKKKRELIIQAIKKNAGQFFGFKDPRVVLTLPFWIEALKPVYIATYRHPIRVAKSLFERNGMPLHEGVELWYQYNSRIYKLLCKNNVALVNFDLNNEAYLADVRQKIKTLGLKPERVDAAVDFFSSDLRNQMDMEVDSRPLPDKVRELYAQFQDYHAEN